MISVFNRVVETSATTGTGTYDLAGAETAYRGFVAIAGDGAEVYYIATLDDDYELGIGTVTDAAPDTLSRDTILASSNADAAVNWGAGSKRIAATAPAESYVGALVPIETRDLTGLTDADFLLPAEFTDFQLRVDGHYNNAASNRLVMRFSDDDGSTFISDTYRYFGKLFDTGGESYDTQGFDKLWFTTGILPGTTLAESAEYVIDIIGANIAGSTPSVFFRATRKSATVATLRHVEGSAQLQNTTGHFDINAFKLLLSSTADFSGGTAELFGVIKP